MLPGFGQVKQLKGAKVDERELDRIQAIVTSMTHKERRNPKLIDGSRRKRIAAGSGTSVQAVNQLVKQFGQMQKMMRSLQQGKMPSMEQLMRGM
jgi:signal recognition particle subunit SRP54